jgi:hypothetical protein
MLGARMNVKIRKYDRKKPLNRWKMVVLFISLDSFVYISIINTAIGNVPYSLIPLISSAPISLMTIVSFTVLSML